MPKVKKYNGTKQNIAKKFLKEESKMFGFKDFEKEMKQQIKRFKGAESGIIDFQQMYEGIPVLNSSYLIAINENNEIYYVAGKIYPDIDLEISPVLDAVSISNIVNAELCTVIIDSITVPILYIVPNELQDTILYSLEYEIMAFTSQPLDELYYLIDAVSGQVKEKRSQVADISGTGSVYKPNPLEQRTPEIDTLNRLNDNSPRELDGTNVIVHASDMLQYPDAQSSTANFIYNITDYRFDQVSAYYHCDEFENWLYGIGLETNRISNQVIVTTIDESGNGVARSFIITQRINFADGSDYEYYQNPTREAAVIAHEYMHIVSYTYNTNLTSNSERLAMSEAYSDYFGLAYSNKFPNYNSSVILEYLDAPGDSRDYKRDLDNNYTTTDYGDEDRDSDGDKDYYDNCVIFSGALWHLRNDPDVSSSVVDEIVLKSLNYLTDNPDFLLGKDAIIAAAINEGYSSYEDDIRDNFHTHGIPFPVTANISGPSSQTFKGLCTFDSNPGGGDSSYIYEWRYRLLNPSPGAWSSVVGTSRTYSRSMVMDDFEVQVKVMSSGESVYDTHIVTYDDGSLNILNHEGELPPIKYSLVQNYPNPFNPSTAIRFTMKNTGFVSLKVYNLLGQEVSQLANSVHKKGNYEVVFDASALPSGIYYYRMTAGNFIETRKMLLVK